MSSPGVRLAENLTLPLDVITETIAILARRGSGKTFAAARMTEQIVQSGYPAVVIDPLGVWWGLRSSADGQGDGLPVVIFGGEHADVPLTEGSGAVIADVIVSERISAIIDLSGLSKAASRRFMEAFITQVYRANRDPLHIVVDEADALAPQQRAGADGAKLLGAMEDLVRRGRVRGLGTTLISQRPAVLHKDVLTQAGILFAMRMSGPRDVAAIDEWVRLHADEEHARELKASLPSLPVGTGWVWAPGYPTELVKIHVEPRTTFDSSATPKVGQTRLVPKKMAAIDIAALGEQITAAVAEAEANNPAALKKQITALQRENTSLRTKKQNDTGAGESSVRVEEKIVEITKEVPVLDPKDSTRLADLTERAERLTDTAHEHLQELLALREQVADLTGRIHTATSSSAPAPQSTPAAALSGKRSRQTPAANPARTATPASTPPTAATDADGPQVQVRAGARRMLEALAHNHPMRLTQAQVHTLAKMKKSGTSSNYWSTLRRAGFIDEDHTGIGITPTGLDFLGITPGSPPSSAEVIDQYRAILRAGARRMFDHIIDAYPDSIARDDLAAAAEMEPGSGTFSNYLSTLRRNGLVTTEHGLVRAADILFLND